MSSAAAQRLPEPETEMPAPEPQPERRTVAEYLEIDRNSPLRHEYVDGVIVAMAGTTPLHNVVAGNIYRSLQDRFASRPCTAYMESVKVRSTSTRYRYPDVVAVCDNEVFDDDNPPALLNPMVIFEVLSPSTEQFDRWEKFDEYRQIPSLTDYLLIEHERPFVLHFARYSATQWLVSEYDGLDKVIPLPALQVDLPLAEIYRKVVFGAA